MRTNHLLSTTIIFLGTFILLIGCDQVQKKQYVLNIKGSESMHDAFDALKADFESVQDSVELQIEGGGSKIGLEAIRNGDAEIGLSSFPFDLDSIFGADHGIYEQIIAYDGIVIVNNRKNPIRELSNEQIAGIFSGEINDWSQVGGNQGKITPIIRDQNSGTQKFFTEHFGVQQVTDKAIIAGENSEIVAKVVGLDSGIGFIGFSYFSESINDVLLESTMADTFVPPTFRHMQNGSYPLKRSLQIYYRNENDPALSAFLAYLDTPRAQSVMEMTGLIPARKL